MGYFCSVIKFNAQILVKCLVTNNFIHMLWILVLINLITLHKWSITYIIELWKKYLELISLDVFSWMLANKCRLRCVLYISSLALQCFKINTLHLSSFLVYMKLIYTLMVSWGKRNVSNQTKLITSSYMSGISNAPFGLSAFQFSLGTISKHLHALSFVRMYPLYSLHGRHYLHTFVPLGFRSPLRIRGRVTVECWPRESK